MDKKAGMTIIVKTITRISTSLILIYGAYIVAYGQVTPGGGFPGGVVLAAAFVLLCLAFGREVAVRKLSTSAAHILDSVGALIFLGVAILGFIGGAFFLNFFIEKGVPFRLFSGGIIPLCNIGIGIKVAVSIFAAFIALILFRVAAKNV